MFLLSNFISSLPNKSSISTSLKFSNIFLSFINSFNPGRILTFALVLWQIFNICFLFSLSMFAIEKNINSTFYQYYDNLFSHYNDKQRVL